jgi:hypothetical protein
MRTLTTSWPRTSLATSKTSGWGRQKLGNVDVISSICSGEDLFFLISLITFLEQAHPFHCQVK